MYRVITALIGATLLTSCAQDMSPDTYSTCGINQAAITYSGTVQNARCVNVTDENNGLGLVAGGVAGGFAGNTLGKGSGNALCTVGGAIAGMAAGAMAERGLKKQMGMEYIVELDNGDLLTVVQGPMPTFQAGQRVYVCVPPRGRARVVAQ